ncbi:hypothetical protein FHT82_006054, partial [Rhizobium sp. BK275]|nr:hypothetical protein [Rhizobium sp. BK275]
MRCQGIHSSSVILGLVPLLSGLNIWTRRMTLILLCFRRFAA